MLETKKAAPKKAAAKKAPAKKAAKSTENLVKMKRGDLIADVHPNEVANYAAGGYVEV